jgi:hypothetical protein
MGEGDFHEVKTLNEVASDSRQEVVLEEDIFRLKNHFVPVVLLQDYLVSLDVFCQNKLQGFIHDYVSRHSLKSLLNYNITDVASFPRIGQVLD